MSSQDFDTKKVEERLKITFEDKTLLTNAFVHRSYHNENPNFEIPSNEKLEFLGDSVLSLITSVYLFKNYPDYQEGDYTDMKAAIVNTNSLYAASQDLGLGEFLFLSKGEEENAGRENKSILADCFEALLGVVYLEKGFDVSYSFVETFLFRDTLDNIITKKLYMPAKNVLQEYYQDKYKKLPEYKVEGESGPEHDKTYSVGVYDDAQMLGLGSGKSKKEAEESAARRALQKLGI
jgi:ribonuclease-3